MPTATAYHNHLMRVLPVSKHNIPITMLIVSKVTPPYGRSLIFFCLAHRCSAPLRNWVSGCSRGEGALLYIANASPDRQRRRSVRSIHPGVPR